MADTRISGLAAIGAALAVGDLLRVVDVSDTSMAGTGTDKQITAQQVATFLAANTAFTAAFEAAGAAVLKSLVDAKGDLFAGTADNTVARLGVGTDGLVLVADSASTPGVKWGRNDITSLMPTGGLAETIDRSLCNAGNFSVATGTLYLIAVYLPAGTVVSTFHALTGGTGNSAMTHSWMGLYNSSRVQLAVSADKTTTSIGSTTDTSFAVATTAGGANSSFTTTYSGLHYIGFMASFSSGSLTMFFFSQSQSVPGGLAPIRVGTSNTGQTTPQAFAFTANALVSVAGVPYFYVT